MREEEKNGVTKMKFRRLLRKKWMYPAIYLSIAAIVLAGVLWYQQQGNDLAENPNSDVNDQVVTDDPFGEDAVPVMESQEKLAMPVDEDSQIVTKFYDYDASEKDQESALVLYENKYYQSTGVDFTKNDEKFDVKAALTGQVTEVKEDPLYGNVVTIEHAGEVSTVYASLGEVKVEAGTEVAQGDVLGTSGRNVFGQASGVHVHFEVRKGDQALNPEEFFGKPLSEIDKAKEEAKEEAKDEQDADATEEQDDAATEGQEDPASEEQGTEPSKDQDNGAESGTEEDVDAPAEGEEGTDTGEGAEQGDDGVADDIESSISTTQT
ncbi:M23 family metallopeptidase [Thalassobacillus pellis]|uniref:M23 family metallopeptidase n=1 Tax=Thalassobacillus pellis TaxID=748008 RepID=UPI00195FE4DD|nr:M23 family metallopeptidase [Thalassobacillus pellis]MBM7551742.1 stage II sporulation protein Q [Thalassobacillus pellis]